MKYEEALEFYELIGGETMMGEEIKAVLTDCMDAEPDTSRSEIDDIRDRLLVLADKAEKRGLARGVCLDDKVQAFRVHNGLKEAAHELLKLHFDVQGVLK
jgi:hypothetical protein